VLLLIQEASVVTVSAMRERLAEAYCFTLPPDALMEALLDKVRFQALAERRGFPIPPAVRSAGSGGAAAAGRLRFPCVLKPTTKHAGYAKQFAKAYKVGSLEEVAQLWSRMRGVVYELIVQEWIEGGDSDI
jgi:predicted ATP-grasp superfamily ATP-dependent carboligase